ncbi:MAG: hypothetical protein IJH63_00800 [Methanobrevibacter sp.]|nr:hypothetical protein [Methanosphaera sp.]MBR0369243.1 hypothetical protein [Methanobrevibacter sp.]
MTENKRFTYDGMDIEDNVEMIEYAICTSDGGLRVTALLNELAEENEQLKQSNKDAWDLIRFIYNEIKEDGYMDFGRIKDLVEFE